MRLQTKATNITLTPEITSYLEKKLDMIEKFVEGEKSEAFMAVELGKTTNHHKTGDIFRAEFTLNDKGKILRSDVETPDLYASMDKAKDEIIRELKNYSTKRRTLFKKGALRLKNIIKGLPWKRN